MPLPPNRPFSLVTPFALVRAASLLVPKSEREGFEYDWLRKIRHRHEFLHQTDLWSFTESIKFLFSSLACVPDAVQHFGAQESVRIRVTAVIQSPFSCLAGLAAILLLVALFSGGFPATRDLLFKRIDANQEKVVYVWTHNVRGGGDRPLPADTMEAWKKHSQLITDIAAFRAMHREVRVGNGMPGYRFVVTTEPSFFAVMGQSQPLAAPTPKTYVVLSYKAWEELYHASPRVKGSDIFIDGKNYPVENVLPAGFEPLSRQATIYMVQPFFWQADAFAALRVKPGVTSKALDKDLTQIAQDINYYFLTGQLRYGFAQSAIRTPVRLFALGLLASGVMLILVLRWKWHTFWPAPNQQTAFLRQIGFFLAKAVLALTIVFTACLEWSRSTSAILFGNFDPASGPFLLWLYILGTTGVLFWAVADQKIRCRQCLQLLAFPVRMGSPGNLFLDWSGTEMCCAEGHGVLHVATLAPSWAEESEHWIALDDSWQSIFGRGKR